MESTAHTEGLCVSIVMKESTTDWAIKEVIVTEGTVTEGIVKEWKCALTC